LNEVFFSAVREMWALANKELSKLQKTDRTVTRRRWLVYSCKHKYFCKWRQCNTEGNFLK